MNSMLSNLDTAAVCRVLIHPNNGVPKVWIAVASTARQPQAYRVWGSLKRGSLQGRESSWNEMVADVIPAKRVKGYREISGQPQWFEAQQLVAAYRDGKPFLSFEGYQLGREGDNVVPDRHLQVALFRTTPGVLVSDGGRSQATTSVPPARVMGKDEILKGVSASTGRPYAW